MITIDRHDTVEYNDIAWVIAARSETKAIMKNIKVEDGCIVATDGYRMHMANCGLPNGTYSIIKDTKQEIILNAIQDTFIFSVHSLESPIDTEFPNWKDVIPDERTLEHKGVIFTPSKFIPAKRSTELSKIVYEIYDWTHKFINIEYIEDLITVSNEKFDIYIPVSAVSGGNGNNGAIIFKGADKKALIMPMGK